MSAERQIMIGPYLIVKTLGMGTTGKVKLAINQETKQEVAIKVIFKEAFKERPNLQFKIQREIALMRLVDHPHLLKIGEVLESSRHLYIVLEYASRGELFDFLIERKFLKEDLAFRFFRQIIYGLEYLHSLGICHRDLKPENILLDEQHNVKIADFGFARFVKTNVAETSCGSPHYAAPEVIRGDPYDGRAADVWSCGVILYALLAGYLPFDDQNVRNLLNKVKRGYYQMPQFQEPVKDLISRMLTLDPAARITISQIKAHPCFRMHLPDEYVLPYPLPVPSFEEPIPLETIPPEVVNLLKKIGYANEDELKQDLMAPEHTMAKVFYFMLTSQISTEQLQWDFSVGGVPTLPDDSAIMIEPAMASYTLNVGDPFHRHAMDPGSMQSVGRSLSVPISAEWAVSEQAIVYEQTHMIMCPGLDLTQAIFAMQILMRHLEMQWFHPDDETIICRHQQGIYVVIQARDADPQTPTTLQLQLLSGPQEGFSVIVRGAEEAIKAFQAACISGE